jgi:hypothetical protein
MIDKNLRRVKAIGYGEQRIEALGQTPHIDFELRDGSIVRLPHYLRLSDEALARFEAFQRGDGLDREPLLDEHGDPKRDEDTGKPLTRAIYPPVINGEPAQPSAVRLMRAVLGDEDYAKLRDHGLTAAELSRMWQSLADDISADGDADPKDG